jgi:hypothetical protein
MLEVVRVTESTPPEVPGAVVDDPLGNLDVIDGRLKVVDPSPAP